MAPLLIHGVRRRHLRLHRRIGRILIPAGFVTAISGLWMSHFYPWPAHDGVALYIIRLFVSGGMIIALLLATDAIRRRKFRQHGAWMIRTYALAMGAGTQVFSHIPIVVLQQGLTLTNRAIAMGAGWLINILVTEWVIATRDCARLAGTGADAKQTNPFWIEIEFSFTNKQTEKAIVNIKE